MKEIEVDYQALCRRLTRGIQEAKRALEEAERDCQQMFDDTVYAQADALTAGDNSLAFRQTRHEFLQNAALEKAKLLK